MRKRATKYEIINKLPSNALVVSLYAEKHKTSYQIIKQNYDRYVAGTTKNPGYVIKCFQGVNFVIPA